MAVPNIFKYASGTVLLEELDTNFATPVTIGTTPVALGATVGSFEGVTLVAPTLTTPTLTTPALGTPASAVLTNCTDLPIATGVSGLAAGASTFLTTPSSANLSALLSDETGTGSNVFATSPTLTTPTVTALNGGQLAGLRNKIINGNMDIAQRGTTAVTTSGLYGPADRFVSFTSGNTFSTTVAEFVSGDTLYDTGGARYYTTVAVTSVAGASNYTIWAHKIENVRLLAGQTVTVHFWAKAAAGTPLIGVEAAQFFGIGGSPSATVTGVGQSVTLSTTWTKYTRTFTVGSLSGKVIGTDANSSYTQLNFWLDAGATFNTRSGTIGQASKTVSIGQVQLEIGSVATPFEQRPYGMELALCQRYYETVNALIMHSPYSAPSTSSEMVTTWFFKQSKRATGASIQSATSITPSNVGTESAIIQLTSNPAINILTTIVVTASLEL